MKYELWFSASENSYELVPASEGAKRPDLLAPDAVQVAVFEAESWEEAQALKHKHLGWEPYRNI